MRHDENSIRYDQHWSYRIEDYKLLTVRIGKKLTVKQKGGETYRFIFPLPDSDTAEEAVSAIVDTIERTQRIWVLSVALGDIPPESIPRLPFFLKRVTWISSSKEGRKIQKVLRRLIPER